MIRPWRTGSHLYKCGMSEQIMKAAYTYEMSKE